MACKSCKPAPPPPIFRRGLPTIWAWGPFLDHEVVPPEEIESYLATLE